jgi:hypothetical protein
MRLDGPSGDIHDEIGGVNSEGFAPWATLRAIARSMDLESFVARYPRPALRIFARGGEHEATQLKLTDREISFKSTMTVPIHGDARRYHDKVAFLSKRPNMPFPNMISIGRAMNSDVVLVLDTISKFHGYFMKSGGPGAAPPNQEVDTWFFVDGKTTNGTHVNGKRLTKGEKRAVGDGDEVALGLEVHAIFLLPKSLYGALTGS